MELVGADDAVDLVAAARRVEAGDAAPEPRDLEYQLGAVELHELDVAGHLIVVPDVVRNRAADMPLQIRVVGDPAARPRVQVHRLRLFLPVAAALPRKHRARVSGAARGSARLGETAIA